MVIWRTGMVSHCAISSRRINAAMHSLLV